MRFKPCKLWLQHLLATRLKRIGVCCTRGCVRGLCGMCTERGERGRARKSTFRLASLPHARMNPEAEEQLEGTRLTLPSRALVRHQRRRHFSLLLLLPAMTCLRSTPLRLPHRLLHRRSPPTAPTRFRCCCSRRRPTRRSLPSAQSACTHSECCVPPRQLVGSPRSAASSLRFARAPARGARKSHHRSRAGTPPR